MLYEKDIKSDGSVEHKHFIVAGSEVIALVKQTSSGTTTRYFHQDHQGSTAAMTNETGSVVERFAYEPFGKRRFPTGKADASNTIVGVNTDRGFTNHEHLDELGLIHMNGRVYDPAIGRFMSADPTVPEPFSLQSFNRYAYVLNNPLAGTDPSGFFCLRSEYEASNCDTTGNFEDGGYSDSNSFTGATPGAGVTLNGGDAKDGYSYSWVTNPGYMDGNEPTLPNVTVSCCAYSTGPGVDATAYQSFMTGWSGTGLGVMGQPSLAERAGSAAATIKDIGISLLPGAGLPDFGANLGEGNYWTALGILGTEVLPFLKVGKGVKAVDSVLNGTAKSAEAAADAAFAAGKRSGAAAELRVGDRVFTGVSGEVVPHNPQVTGALMGTPQAERAAWHGACAEIACLDKALNAGVNPAGGTMRAVNIGVSGAGHNTSKVICSSCNDILDYFGVGR